MPAAKPPYGVLNVTYRNQQSEDRTHTLIALMILVAGLAAANIWFLALPLFETPHRAPHDCQTFVLTNSGVTKCIPETTRGQPILRPEN